MRECRRLLGILMLAGLFLSPAKAQAPHESGGIFDLEQVDSPKKCRITLRHEPFGAHKTALFKIAFPAGCRRALPILKDVVAWSREPTGGFHLHMATGAELLHVPKQSEPERRDLPFGDRLYRFTPVNRHANQILSPAPPATATPSSPAQSGHWRKINAADLAGHYRLLRKNRLDTGCGLDLLLEPAQKAALQKGCKDEGLLIFAPTGWAVEGASLYLIAAKGHRIVFDQTRGTFWEKGPGQGEPLFLSKE